MIKNIILLNDGSLLLANEYFQKTELYILKCNENKKWEITKKEEFEGEKKLSIDNIYIFIKIICLFIK